jgi:inhibitor of KinA
MIHETPKYRLVGDNGLLVELGERITPNVNCRVQELMLLVQNELIKGVIELNPGFRWLLVIYDPLVIAPTELIPRITDLAAKAMDSRLTYLPPVFVPFF